MRAGYSNSVIFTIEGGAKGTAEDQSVPNNKTYVSADQALSVLGNDAYVIIDVRATKRYEAGHLKGSVSLPLFTVDADDKNVPVKAPYEDDLSKAFVKYATDNKEALTSKTIYVLCNSGATGAANAKVLLEKVGITGNVYTIEGGATKNESIQKAFVTDDNTDVEKPADKPAEKPSSPATGDMASPMGYILIMLAAVAVILANKKRFA